MDDESIIFSVDYDSLPATYDIYPDILYLFLNFFEKYISRFRNFFYYKYKLSHISDNAEEYDKEMLTIYSQFTRLLKELPKSFIDDELSYLFMEKPSKEAAYFLLASLSESKFKCLKRFLDIIKEAKKDLIHPLSYDNELCLLFTHNQSVFGLFNFLTEQDNAFSVFPFVEFHSVIPPKPPNSYPDIDILSFTLLNEQRNKENQVENIENQNPERTLKDLYEDAIDHANYMGLNDECLGEISEIPMKDAQFHKEALKSILTDFEIEYEELFHVKPDKIAKENISILYNLYKQLKKRCKRTHLDDLMDEKKLLQSHLNEYRKEFKKKYGRDIENEEDKEPIKEDYKRYKEVKQEIYYITHENTK